MAEKLTPELSRFFHLDKIGAKSSAHFHVKADPSERKSLAERFGLVELKKLEVNFTIEHGAEEGDFKITGTGIVDVMQSCVVTLKDVPACFEFPIHLLAREGEEDPIDENDLSFLEEELDIEYYQNNQLDMGEIAAQYLALSLDPYPHAEGVENIAEDNNKKSVDEIVSPFAILQKLKGDS